MDKLIALDECVAFYEHDEKPVPGFDAYEYIKDLTEIRTERNARSLVSFLHKYPVGLVVADPVYSVIDDEGIYSKSSRVGATALSTRKMKNAVAKLNQVHRSSVIFINDEYFDLSDYKTQYQALETFFMNLPELFELDKIAASSTSREATVQAMKRKTDIYEMSRETIRMINIVDVVEVRDQINEILGLASLACGMRDENDKPFKSKLNVRSEERMHTVEGFADNGSGSMFVHEHFIDVADLISLLPWRCGGSLSPQSLSPQSICARISALAPNSALSVDLVDDEQTIRIVNQYHTTDEGCDPAVYGAICSWVLLEWREHFGAATAVVFDRYDSSFTKRESYTNDVVGELERIILEGRFDICPACGRMFVGKRREANGKLSKETCTQTCKNKRSESRGAEVDNG